MNGARKIHHVLALTVLDNDGEANVKGTDERLSGAALGANHGRLAVEIPLPVVSTNPIGQRRHGVTLIVRYHRVVGVVVLGEHQAKDVGAPHVAEARIDQREQFEVRVVSKQRFRNDGDASQVVVERPILTSNDELTVPIDLGLDDAEVVRLAGDTTRGEASDELLHLGTNTVRVGLVEIDEFRDLTSGQITTSHENLPSLRSIKTILANQLFGNRIDRMLGIRLAGMERKRKDYRIQSLNEYGKKMAFRQEKVSKSWLISNNNYHSVNNPK